MTWELTWPLALADLAVVLVVHGLLDTNGETLDSLWAVVSFFVVSPWVVRRALALPYDRKTVAVVQGESVLERLTYQQSLKVMWLLAWRSLLLALCALLVLSGMFRLLGLRGSDLPTPGPLTNALGLSAIDALTSLAFFPLLIPGMIRKRYKSFHLELREASPAPGTKPVPRVKLTKKTRR